MTSPRHRPKDPKAALTSERPPAIARDDPRLDAPRLEPVAAAITTDGDLQIAPETLVREELFTGGVLGVGRGATLERSATAGAGASIGEDARIAGPLTITGPTFWGVGASCGPADLRGQLLTGDGVVRAQTLEAREGIRSGVGLVRKEGAA